MIGPTIFSLIFHCFFSEQISLEPPRILDFLAPDSICKYQNRQTNLLNFIKYLVKLEFVIHFDIPKYLPHYIQGLRRLLRV